MARAAPTRYEQIGHGYARTRREDPRLAARIHTGLGEARTVVNVGAGTGSYEPRDRHVIAIEPSDVMAAQRPRDRAPAIRASAGPCRYATPAWTLRWRCSAFTTGTPSRSAGADCGVSPAVPW